MVYILLSLTGADGSEQFLLRIMRGSLATGYVPKGWRRALVTFIPKSGERDWTAKSYRVYTHLRKISGLHRITKKQMYAYVILDIPGALTILTIGPSQTPGRKMCEQYRYRMGKEGTFHQSSRVCLWGGVQPLFCGAWRRMSYSGC